MIDPGLMRQLNNLTFRTQRRKGRNESRIWLLTKLGWHFVTVPLTSISAAGGNPNARGLEGVFANNDRGIQNMKDWCEANCTKKWRYEPAGVFIFKSVADATLFKLAWWNE